VDRRPRNDRPDAEDAVHNILSDCQHACRLIGKAPFFTILVVASLGVGIGANAAIFSLLDQIVLRPLPVSDPHRLVQLRMDGEFVGNTWGDGSEMSYPMFLDLREHQAFSGVFAQFPWALHVTARGRTERINGELVSGRYFSTLGIQPAAGRLIDDRDDRLGDGAPVAVLSHAYWQSHYHGDHGVVGQTLTVNSHPFTIIGVAGANYHGIDVGAAARIFVPMATKPQLTPGWNGLDDRRSRFAKVFARLHEGVSADQAQSALQPVFRRIRESELADATFAGKTDQLKQRFLDARLEIVSAARGHSNLSDEVRSSLWILMAIGGVVLLVACANIAGLLLARGMGRAREIAVRLALGATRRRVAAQLLVESLVLGLLGAAAGTLVASWSVAPLMGLLVGDEGTAVSTSPDLRLVGFAALLGVATACFFGLFPAIHASRLAARQALKDRTATVGGRSEVRLRKGLVAAQVALALLLVVSSLLFLRSVRHLTSQSPGFVTSNLIAFGVEPSLNGYSPEQTKTFASRLERELEGVPGVSAVGIAAFRILRGGSWNSGITATADGLERTTLRSFNNIVMPGYFAAMRIPLLRGRDFTEADRRTGPAPAGEPYRVAIANQLFVNRFLNGADPLTARVGFGQDPGTATPIQIVGVVGTSKYIGMKNDAEPQLFFPLLEDEPTSFTVYVRTAGTPEALFETVRETVQTLDPMLPIFDLMTMETQAGRSIADDRMIAVLATLLAAIGTILCIVGLYGVVAYAVLRRTREVGVRVALGALRRQITLLFFREAVVVVGVGVLAALPLLFVAARFIEAELYGIRALNLPTIAIAVVALTAVALAGALLPALKAARIQPVSALRSE
jgi:predicted permease